MKRLLFHISGRKGSGKTTLLEWFSNDGYFTTEVRFHLEKAIARGEFNPKDIPDPFWWTEQMVNLCYQDLKEKSLVFITGLYHHNELDYFIRRGYGVHNIGISVKTSKRHERILRRIKEKEGHLTAEDLHQKDRKREGRILGYKEKADVESLIRDSEILLSNDGTLQDFKGEYLRLKKFLAETYKV